MKLLESGDHGDVSGVAEVLNVFYTGWDGGVRGEGEKEGSDGRVGGEEGREEGEVFGGDEDGDFEIAEREVVGKVEKCQHMALSWVWKYQDVRSWIWSSDGHGGWTEDSKGRRQRN